MWSATIQSVDKVEGQIRIVVNFTNGIEKFNEVHLFENLTPTILAQRVQSRLYNITASYDFADTLSAGDTISLPLETPPTPLSKEETEKIAYLQKYRQLDALKRAVDSGAMPANAPELAALKQAAQTDFKPEYLNAL